MSREKPTLSQRAVSEAVGTALLLATVVGSGIMGERLADGNLPPEQQPQEKKAVQKR